MARSDPQFNLRIPAELKQRIEDAARSSGRSATAEIIARLEASFEPVEVARPAEMGHIVDVAVNATISTLEKHGWRPPSKTKGKS